MSFAVLIRVAIAAARSAPRSEPAKSHDFLPRAKPRSARSAALLKGMMLPAPLLGGAGCFARSSLFKPG